VKRFGGFPVKDKTVAYNPYVTGRVITVSEKDVVLDLEPVRETVDSEFGSARIQVVDDRIQITLTPKMGAPFNVNGQQGKVVAADDKHFTVDYNNPLAGKNIVFDVQVVGLTKAADFAGKKIQWIEAYDKGLAAAEKLNKPAVLVLYATWCGYSKKMFNTTLLDPRIKMMKDDFVWVKVDSHKQNYLKELYEQTGYPMTVLLDTHGEVIESIKGFKPANEFIAHLKKALNRSGADSKLEATHQMKKGA
jgi:thioredoxin-related protein